MKRIMVLAGIALVLGLVFAACDNGNGGEPTVTPVSITVQGLTEHNSSFGALRLLGAGGAVVASSAPSTINGGSVTAAMLDVQGRPLLSGGNFSLEFVISPTASADIVWYGYAANRFIGEGNTPISIEAFTAWEANPAPDADGNRPVPGDTPVAQFDWLRRNARSGSSYLIEVGGSVSMPPQILSFSGRSNVGIILRGSGTGGTITLSQNGRLFNLNGFTLTLDEGITLQGRNNNTDPVVAVWEDGKLVMNAGSRITGNINTSSRGGGVVVGDGGTFIMNGGEILNNSIILPGEEWTAGGGVVIWRGGTFVMHDGEISGNTSSRVSGGVHVQGNFTMHGGKITGNRATRNDDGWTVGGGVQVDYFGTFVMHDGEISDNTAMMGGGIAVNDFQAPGGTFEMRGGVISGNTASMGGGVDIGNNPNNPGTATFRISDGVIYGNEEAVDLPLRNTASLSASLFGTALLGTFNNGVFSQSVGGTVNNSNNTIRVENGQRQ